MSWEFAPNFDAAFRAAMVAGKSMVYVCPPAWWTTQPLLNELPAPLSSGIQTVVLVPDAAGLREGTVYLDSIAQFRPVHPATGLARSGRLLAAGQVSTLVVAPLDLLRLLARSGIELNKVERILICWPELLTEDRHRDAIEAILAECRDTQRVVFTTDSAALADFLERHARRAPTAFAASAGDSIGSARYAVTDFPRTLDALNAALDILNPSTALVWDPMPTSARFGEQLAHQPGIVVSANPAETTSDLAIALELPTPDVFALLASSARNVLLLVRAFQVPFLRRMLESARPLRLPSEADRAHDQAYRLRQEIRNHIDEHSLSDGLLALSPLFDEHDPATVAAALASRLSLPVAPEGVDSDVQSWIRIRVDAGKKHRLRTGDLVGALLNAVEIPKHRVGRVDVRDGYSLVEVRSDVADKAVKGLNGLVLRGNKLTARPDRH